MKRAFVVVALIAAGVTVAAVASSWAAGTSAAPTVHVIEHATTDKVINTGAHGDTSGDLLTFHNVVFNAANTAKVGRDQGECIRISPAAGSWECRWITFVKGGGITVEGPFNDNYNTTLAVTGGTGIYRNARGIMKIVARPGAPEFDFKFFLTM
jgi:allene oxide cyclase